jgi:uncharacterized protein (TIGR03067 family)
MKREMVLTVALACLVGADETKKGQGALEGLQGNWVLASSERDGNKLTEDQVKAIRRTIKGNELTVTRDGEEILKATLKVDASKKPMTIDITLDGGEGQTLKGIYELNGEEQKVCYGRPGEDRPTEFAAGEGRTLSVWKKEKK